MGLTLNRGNNKDTREDSVIPARNKEYEGVKKDGRTVNSYGVNRGDLGLGLFDENGEQERAKWESKEPIELKLNSQEDPNDVFRLGEQMQEEPKGLKLSGQANATKSVGDKNANPWDNPYDEYKGGPRSISKPIDHRTYKKKEEREQHPVLLISFILMTAVFVCEIAVLAWISAQNDVDVQYNLMKFVWVFGVVPIVVFLDAILVNALYKKKISLILLGWLLPFVYPLKRGNFTNGHSVTGHIVCWGSLVAYISVILMISEAVSNYGVIVQMSDAEIRHKAAAVLDQDIRGIKASSRIMPNMNLETAICEQVDGEEVVYLIGKDSLYVEGYAFVDTGENNIDTVLGFAKNDAGQYELIFVSFAEQVLNKAFIQTYWDEVLGL
ncbi:MAG: hypothetical protein IJP29_05040 [Lachnospiraceae bacterium]|nr:hypothetical protein [Lachnospiraceae bacterium]